MDSLKTYEKVDASNLNIDFAVSRMEDLYEKRGGIKDDPHRHDFFTVLLIENAKGFHNIDFNSYKMGSKQVFFVSPGQVHQVIEEDKPKGFVFTFSTQFLIKNSIRLSFVDSLNLFQEYGHSPPLQPDDQQFNKLISFTNEIQALYHGENKLKELSIGSYLKLFLIECNSICSMDPLDNNSDISENRIIREFKEWVDRDFKKQHSSSYYAERLAISPDHLNRVIKSIMNKTAKEYIQSRITTEAKRLLYFSELSNKEIAYELGFNEPGNFSAFFKKCTHFSPSEFRHNSKA